MSEARSATTEMMRARETWGRYMSWPEFKEAWATREKEEPMPFGLADVPMKLKYWNPDTGIVTGAGPVKFEEEWYDDWLSAMVGTNEEIIFFLVTDSTDVFEHTEPPFDYNTVVMGAGDGTIIHTFDPNCPEGCRGQLEGCEYKRERDEAVAQPADG